MSDEVRQEDRKAAIEFLVNQGTINDVAEAFARHRAAEAEQIAAWLRSDAVNELHDANKRIEHTIADAITRGDHRNG
jgi:hypothetical protein